MKKDYFNKYKTSFNKYYNLNGGSERPIPAPRPTPAPRPIQVPRPIQAQEPPPYEGPHPRQLEQHVERIPTMEQLNPLNYEIHYLPGQQEELIRLNTTPPLYDADNSLYFLIGEALDNFQNRHVVTDYKILILKKKLNLSSNDYLSILNQRNVEPKMFEYLEILKKKYQIKVIGSIFKYNEGFGFLRAHPNIHIVYPNNIFVSWYCTNNGTIKYINSDQYISYLKYNFLDIIKKYNECLTRNRELKQKNRELEQRNRELEQRNRREIDNEPVMRCIAAPVNGAVFTNSDKKIGSEFLNLEKKLDEAHLNDIDNIILKFGGNLNASPVEFSDKPILNLEKRNKLIKLIDQEYEKNKSNDVMICLSKNELLDYITEETYNNIKIIFKNSIDTIKIRRVIGDKKIINFHTDYSQKTMQIALNDENEYKGGKITFINNDKTFFQPNRNAGSYTIHNSGIVHGVSKLEDGVRYSLFLCDTYNKELEYLIEPVLNQIIFFKKATKYLEKTTDTELLNYVNNYKNIFINKLISKLDLSFGLEIVWKTHMLHPEEYNKSTINFDMVKAIRRQELFMKDILKLNINKEIISKAVQEYNNFLELFKLGNRNNLAPKPIVDLIWHTHQQFPEKYKTECVKFAGVFLNHNDDVEKEIIQKAYEERKNIEKINK
jgi:hypothetical protein